MFQPPKIHKKIQLSSGNPYAGMPRLRSPIALEDGRIKNLIYRLKKVMEARFTDMGKPIMNFIYCLDMRTVPKELRGRVV